MTTTAEVTASRKQEREDTRGGVGVMPPNARATLALEQIADALEAARTEFTAAHVKQMAAALEAIRIELVAIRTHLETQS